jgi:hypothetical protein
MACRAVTPEGAPSTTGNAVERLSQKVGVAIVAGVLPNQVHVDHPQRHRVTFHVDLVREWHRGNCLVCESPLLAQPLYLLLGTRRVDVLQSASLPAPPYSDAISWLAARWRSQIRSTFAR